MWNQQLVEVKEQDEIVLNMGVTWMSFIIWAPFLSWDSKTQDTHGRTCFLRLSAWCLCVCVGGGVDTAPCCLMHYTVRWGVVWDLWWRNTSRFNDLLCSEVPFVRFVQRLGAKNNFGLGLLTVVWVKMCPPHSWAFVLKIRSWKPKDNMCATDSPAALTKWLYLAPDGQNNNNWDSVFRQRCLSDGLLLTDTK